VLLEHQDRSRWDRAQIGQGLALVPQALSVRPPGRYAVQAAIAALHVEATDAVGTDWAQIVALYDVARRIDTDNPVLELNRAVALSMRDGAQAGLAAVDALMARGELHDYLWLHAARADMLRRLDRRAEAHAAYGHAIKLARQEAQRQFLERRRDALLERPLG
jgi:RNA polymerase sigma-70 factor, ECF subfamily